MHIHLHLFIYIINNLILLDKKMQRAYLNQFLKKSNLSTLRYIKNIFKNFLRLMII